MHQFDAAATGPLQDVRVIDLSRLVAGNMTTHVLADYGADVIKIERPDRGDDLRNWRCKGQEIYWKVYARNKRSLALDIRSDAGRAELLELVETAQVLVENFLPGALEKWGLGPDVLLERNPTLVILRISGWGQTGPYRDKPGFGTLVEAMSGWSYLNGHADRPPTLPPVAMADTVAGLYGVGAVLTALRVVERPGGRGQVIDLSLFEPALSLIGAEASQFKLTGMPTMRSGSQSSHTFDTIGRPELRDDPRFADNDARVENRDALDEIIGAFIAQRSQEENLNLFAEAGVTVGPLCSIADLINHPYVCGPRGAGRPARC